MKVKLIASDASYDTLAQQLLAHGIELDNDAPLILQEANIWPEHLMCRQGTEYFRIAVRDMIYIESLAREILVHTLEGTYKAGERLWQLEQLLPPQTFLRISNSVIVGKAHIRSIKPALSQKFLLTLSDGTKVDVTRTYYHAFREAMGI